MVFWSHHGARCIDVLQVVKLSSLSLSCRQHSLCIIVAQHSQCYADFGPCSGSQATFGPRPFRLFELQPGAPHRSVAAAREGRSGSDTLPSAHDGDYHLGNNDALIATAVLTWTIADIKWKWCVGNQIREWGFQWNEWENEETSAGNELDPLCRNWAKYCKAGCWLIDHLLVNKASSGPGAIGTVARNSEGGS